MAHMCLLYPAPPLTPWLCLCIYDVENILRSAAQAESMITLVGKGAGKAGKIYSKMSRRIYH